MALTPADTKHPFPSSRSIAINPDRPSSWDAWRTSLKEIKVLFLKRQYKECRSSCDWLLEDSDNLPHPTHMCYVQFLAALSDELAATSMRNFQTAKLPLLESAKASYNAALISLRKPGEILLHDEVDALLFDGMSIDSDIHSLQYTPTPAPKRPLTAPPSPPSPSRPQPVRSLMKPVLPPLLPKFPRSRSELPQQQSQAPPNQPWLAPSISWTSVSQFDSPIHRPSPLRVRKLEPMTSSPAREAAALQTPPSSPISDPGLRTPTPKTVAFSEATTTWLQDRAQQRYDVHRMELMDMVQGHIDAVDQLIEATKQAQMVRQTVSIGFDDGEKSPVVERQARIKDLRARGWLRERFRPERYQELARKALSEL
ncbi:hypothetical protein MMC30_000259 [Trapelia coarctata]|nr:hypothetical protein [Trapelia coarctata]